MGCHSAVKRTAIGGSERSPKHREGWQDKPEGEGRMTERECVGETERKREREKERDCIGDRAGGKKEKGG